MEIVKCANGHFYDADRFGNDCPYCNTRPVEDETTPVNPPLEPMDDDTTQAFFGWKPIADQRVPDRNRFVGPVVGWVVAIDGPYKGMDFPLKTGRNFIGRSPEMDISLDDKTISRDRHAVIVYEPISNRYLVQPGEASELFYLNDEVVLAAKEIKPYDVIALGKTHLVFIPLCTDSFRWEREEEET